MVKVRLIGLVESVSLDVSDNSYNRQPRSIWTSTSFYSHTQRISIVEVALCKRFVNQDNRRRLPVVCVGKESAAFQRGLDRAKIIRRDDANLRGGNTVVSGSVAFNQKATGIMWTNQWNSITAANRGSAYARDRTHSVQQFLYEPGSLQGISVWIQVGIIWHRQPD